MVKKLYMIPKVESLKLDVDVWFLGSSNVTGEGDDDDDVFARRRQEEYYGNSSTRGNKQRGGGWGSLW